MKTKLNKFADSFFEWANVVVMAVFVMIFVFTFLFRIACVQGHSMEKTLYNNDRLIVSHLFYTPKQNDIIVVDSKVMNEFIIKRVIAVEFQKVTIDYSDNTVSVDGKIIDEPYINAISMELKDSFIDVSSDEDSNKYEYTVPKDCVFVMGDNRNNSTDSRMFGFVENDEIVGRVMFRFYSEQATLGRVD